MILCTHASNRIWLFGTTWVKIMWLTFLALSYWATFTLFIWSLITYWEIFWEIRIWRTCFFTILTSWYLLSRFFIWFFIFRFFSWWRCCLILSFLVFHFLQKTIFNLLQWLFIFILSLIFIVFVLSIWCVIFGSWLLFWI